jgi:hypothetical protein
MRGEFCVISFSMQFLIDHCREYNLCTRTTSLTGMASLLRTRIQFQSFLTLPFTRDCTSKNIMLDPSNMYPESFHPVKIDRSSKNFDKKAKRYSRTRRPTRYLLIDFGLSRRYDPVNGPPLDKKYRGIDKSAPEHQDMETPCDPFPTDVYYLGNLVRKKFMMV